MTFLIPAETVVLVYRPGSSKERTSLKRSTPTTYTWKVTEIAGETWVCNDAGFGLRLLPAHNGPSLFTYWDDLRIDELSDTDHAGNTVEVFKE